MTRVGGRPARRGHEPRGRGAERAHREAEAAAPSEPRLARPLLAVLGALLLMRVAAAFSPSNWLWGLDTLRYWPRPLGVLVALLAAAGFAPPLSGALERALAGVGAAWERAPRRGDALLALAVAALVFTLRDTVQFAGDFALRVGALATSLAPHRLFPQAFPLDAVLHFGLARALVLAGWSAENALQAIGAAMSALFAVGCARFVRACGARGPALAAGVLVLVAGGELPHFAGYEKYGPMLAGIAFAAAGAVRLAREGAAGEWELSLGALAAALSHRAGLAVAPAAVLALAIAFARAPLGRRRTSIGLAGLALLAGLAALAPLAWHVLTTIDASVHLPGGKVARTLGAAGPADLLLRLADTFNALLFLAPLALAGAAAAALPAGTASAEKPGAGGRAMLAATAWTAIGCALALMLVVRASRGGGRDWDASTGPALVLALASTGALIALWRRGAKQTIAPAVTLALACAATSWALQASESMNLARIETLLAASPAWSESARSFAHDHVGLYDLNHARWDDAARHFETAYALEPNPRYAYQAGLAHLKAGRAEQADRSFREAIRRGTRAADPWTGLAALALARRDSAAAAALADSALARNPRDAQAAAIARAARGTAAR